MGKEIERKFLIKKIPFSLENLKKFHIYQKYLSSENDSLELRIRAIDDLYFFTVKQSKDNYREEFEKKISEKEFQYLQTWQTKEQKREIKKVRYHIPHENLLIELDIYKDNLAGLVTAEIEFPTIEESKEFQPLPWFYQEITKNKLYKNFYLSLKKSIEGLYDN